MQDLSSRPGIPPIHFCAMEAWSLNHRTIMEIPNIFWVILFPRILSISSPNYWRSAFLCDWLLHLCHQSPSYGEGTQPSTLWLWSPVAPILSSVLGDYQQQDVDWSLFPFPLLSYYPSLLELAHSISQQSFQIKHLINDMTLWEGDGEASCFFKFQFNSVFLLVTMGPTNSSLQQSIYIFCIVPKCGKTRGFSQCLIEQKIKEEKYNFLCKCFVKT